MATNVKSILPSDPSNQLAIRKKKLRESCQEFESVMISYLMKTMNDGTMRAEKPGNAKAIYEEMLNGQISKEIARTSAMGIGDTLYARLEGQVKLPNPENTECAQVQAQADVAQSPAKAPGSG